MVIAAIPLRHLTMTSTTLFAALLVALTVFTVNGKADFKCILQHCEKESLYCGADPNCFLGLICMAGCNGNMSCTYSCQATFWDEALTNMVDCALSRNKCIVPPNLNPTTCKKPEELAQNFEVSLLTGLFYNVYGKNKDYDCFNHDVKMITKRDNMTLLLTNSYDLVRHDGTPRTFTDRLELNVIAANNPAILNLKTLDPGMQENDEYRILAATKSYVIAYYCGTTCSITYEGVQVFSRTPTLSKADLASVSAEITKRGWNLSKFCRPKQTALL